MLLDNFPNILCSSLMNELRRMFFVTESPKYNGNEMQKSYEVEDSE